MHIASQWVVEHFPVESPSTQSEAIASSARGSHETLGFGIFLGHIYYSLYIRREARRDLDTAQAFKKDVLLFFGKSVAARTLILLWMQAVSVVHTLLVLPCFRCIFCLPIQAQEA